MEIQLNAWEFDELKMEIKSMTPSQITSLYEEKEAEYNKACQYFVKSGMKEEIEKECNKLFQEKLIIAVKLADRMTGISSTL